ncbi:hypothetical protein LEP1GSC192_2653 [Leptospira sp. B5-022]|nr:hypothetical protein LEP1GSC192_2653 [Leptospira sp. B5-022]MCR1795560.1 hypothetical protein [Leptospira sp. id769339]
MFNKQWKNFKHKSVFRFLLHKGHWIFEEYVSNKEEALGKAIKDLSPKDDNLSVFIVKNEGITENFVNEIELITFIYAASARDTLQHLYYVDIEAQSLYNLKLNIRHNPNTRPKINAFYSDRHYELFYVDDEKRRQLAELIFSIISTLPEKKPLSMKKDKLRLTKSSFHENEMVKMSNLEHFAPWAKA